MGDWYKGSGSEASSLLWRVSWSCANLERLGVSSRSSGRLEDRPADGFACRKNEYVLSAISRSSIYIALKNSRPCPSLLAVEKR